MTPLQKKIVLFCSSIFILAVNIIGAIGMAKSGKYFEYIPSSFLLMSFLILVNHGSRKRDLAIFMMIVSTMSFWAEFFAVSTGFPFGSYYYTATLGTKLFEVPIFIGLFYFCLVYSVNNVLLIVLDFIKSFFTLKNNPKIFSPTSISFLSSALILMLDYFLIEKTAKKLNWWIWLEYDQEIPALNYTSWFVLFFVQSLIFFGFKFSRKNYFSIPVLVSILVFFIMVTIM